MHDQPRDRHVPAHPTPLRRARVCHTHKKDGCRRAICVAWLAIVCWGVAAGRAEEALPLYESEPFDQITLVDRFQNGQYRVYPVEIPTGTPNPNDNLRVRLLDFPERYYDIAWKNIERYEQFPELVLAEANRLIREKQFDQAYWHLDFLKKEYPRTPGIDAAISSLLFQDAGNAYREGAYAEALSLLDEVYRQNPNRASVATATENVARKMFEQYVAQNDYLAAREMLQWTEARFGRQRMSRTLSAWEEQLSQLAQQELDVARKDAQAGRMRQAYDTAYRALRMWPTLPGLAEFANEVARQYPVVKVGVTRPARDLDPRRAEDWAARRAGRLRYRTLVELKGYGPEGGEYFCPVGALTVSADAREMTIRLRPGSADSMASLFTGYDLSNVLLEMARPGGANEVPLWSQLAGSIAIKDVYTVQVQLTQPVLRPESLLQTPLGDIRPDSAGPTNPYLLGDRDSRQLRFILNEQYVERQATQPMEIIENYFDDPAELVSALERAEIDVVDRLFPGDVEPLQRDEKIVVRRYAVPSVHFLVPNFQQPLIQRRAFRRALVYGISRRTILEQDLLGNTRLPGCQLISGPFPAGVTVDDPLGYAYNRRVAPRDYEPSLALTLAEIARGELRGIAEKAGADPPVDRPLVLLHPAAAVPRIASSAISQYLTAIGIACETREMRPGETKPTDNEWDLLYVDMVITEPMFDIRRLLGARGLIAGGSSYLELALRRLGLAVNWEQSRETLHDIHRLAHEEVAVVPLWQLTEFFAFHPRLKGVAEFPLSLYQNVEAWQIAPSATLAGS